MNRLDFSNRCEELRLEAERLASRAKTKASLMRACCIFINFLIITLGVGVGVVGVVGSGQSENSTFSQAGFYVVTVLGFLISSLKGILSATGLEQRGVLNRQLSLRLAKISRALWTLQQSIDESGDLQRKLQALEEDFEQMVLQSFEMGTEVSRSRNNTLSIV